MGVISQNTLSLIIAPPSVGNLGQQYIIKFFTRCDLYVKFGEFGGMIRQRAKVLSQVETCSGPNKTQDI